MSRFRSNLCYCSQQYKSCPAPLSHSTGVNESSQSRGTDGARYFTAFANASVISLAVSSVSMFSAADINRGVELFASTSSQRAFSRSGILSVRPTQSASASKNVPCCIILKASVLTPIFFVRVVHVVEKWVSNSKLYQVGSRSKVELG